MEAQGRVRVTLSPIAALALELEGSAQRAVVPTFRRAHSTQALVAPLDRQIQEIEHEAGVRKSSSAFRSAPCEYKDRSPI